VLIVVRYDVTAHIPVGCYSLAYRHYSVFVFNRNIVYIPHSLRQPRILSLSSNFRKKIM